MKGNAANENDVAKQNEIDRIRLQKEIDDLTWLMNDKRGRRFMWRLLNRAHIYESSFTGNSHTFFNEGERNIGLRYLAEIHANCAASYLDMMSEAQKENTDG